MNHLQLKAQRQALGLTVPEICALVNTKSGKPMSERYWRYLELGSYGISGDVKNLIHELSQAYQALLDSLTTDLKTQDSPPPLPFFFSFDSFVSATGSQSQVHWRIWQSVLGHLLVTGQLTYLDDSAPIPTHFTSHAWLFNDKENS